MRSSVLSRWAPTAAPVEALSAPLARIERAKRDWKDGRFPKVPGDDAEFIPLPE